MINIAVDGPAGAGKGTVANFLSQKFNLKHLDTGLLYREVARLALACNIALDDADAIKEIALKIDLNSLNAAQLRTEQVSGAASKIAVFPEVREVLTSKMRVFAHDVSAPFQGAVLDGRDVGTSVLPNADLKFYITADEKVRAERRTNELAKTQETAELQTVLKAINERDNRDQTRASTPLQAAPDALIIDTTFMSIEQVFAKVSEIVESFLSSDC